MQNGLVESFVGRMREECLNEYFSTGLSVRTIWGQVKGQTAVDCHILRSI